MTEIAGPAYGGRRRMKSGAPQPSGADLTRIRELYDLGRLHDAYRQTVGFPPLREWHSSTEAMILAARLSYHLGAPRTADALVMLAWRREPADQQARYYAARTILTRRGPLDALEMMDRCGDMIQDRFAFAEWIALRAQILGRFRDFSAANSLLDRARKLAPKHPWVALESAHLLELQDKYEEALSEARRALAIQPSHHGALVASSHLLVLLGRDDEAIAALFAALQYVQSATVAGSLAGLLTERGRYQEALEAWELARLYVPLAEKPTREAMAGHLSHLQYLVASRARRVQLDVKFIKQHHVTCVPTTLAMIGRFWKRDVEHLSIADQITYGGTLEFRAREWADNNGWITREFTLGWEAAVALIDRGLPLALTTTWVGGGHAQAVMGYDSHRRTLLIRDPSNPGVTEIEIDTLLKHQAAGGPRAAVMVPRENAALLDGIELPEVRERDILHQLLLDLEKNDRASAVRHCERLSETAPRGRIALQARLRIAMYDRDAENGLAAVDELLQLYPNDAVMLDLKLGYLDELSRFAEREALIEAQRAREDPDATSLKISAGGEEADLERRIAFVRRALRSAPYDPEGMDVLARLLSSAGKLSEAAKVLRFAACLADTNEQLASEYFRAAASAGHPDEGLVFLQERFERALSHSGSPAMTLEWALTNLERQSEALAVLKRATGARPDDGHLALVAAEANARFGSVEEAVSLMKHAERITRRADFFSTLAAIRAHRGELAGALAAWRSVHQLEPLLPSAHEAIVGLLLQLEGPAAARGFLDDLVRRFPHYQPAQQQLVGFLQEVGDFERAEQNLRSQMEVSPRDAWVHVSLAQVLTSLGRMDEALAACERAMQIAPGSAVIDSVRGEVLLRAGRFPEAKACALRAIETHADTVGAWHVLARACATGAELADELRRLADVTIRKSVLGAAVAAFYNEAADALDGDELLDKLRYAVEQRPALSICRTALIRHLLKLGRNEEAAAAASEAVRRFPFDSEIHLVSARAFSLGGLEPRRQGALEAALRLDPTNPAPALQLAKLLEQNGQSERAAAMLRAAARRSPLDPAALWALSNLLWREGKQSESVDTLARAARNAPLNDSLWGLLAERDRVRARSEAETLVRERPNDPAALLTLAEMETDPAPRLALIDRALATDRRNAIAYQMKIDTLAALERWDEALMLCGALGNNPLLRARSAWIWAHRNDLPRAIQIMRKVLQDNPRLSWGWKQLVEWYAATNDVNSRAAAATMLVEIDPDDPDAWKELAASKITRSLYQEAEDHLRHALILDPAHVPSGILLINLLLAMKRREDAATVIESLAKQVSHPFIYAKVIEVETERGVTWNALQALGKLLEAHDAPPDDVVNCVHMVLSLDPGEALTKVLIKAAERPDPTPGAAASYIEMLVGAGRAWTDAQRYIDRLEPSEASQAAARVLIECAARYREPAAIDRFLIRGRAVARSDVKLWGMVGYAFHMTGRFKEAVDWLSDWRNRPAEAWMLFALATSQHALGQDEAAIAVHRHALTLPVDDSSNAHALWLCFAIVLSGDVARYRSMIKTVDANALDGLHSGIRQFAEAIACALTNRSEGRKLADPILDSVFSIDQYVVTLPILLRLFEMTISAIQSITGGLGAGFWASSWRSKVKKAYER